MPTQLYNSQGRAVLLGRKLGEGGEGVVYESRDQGDLVAKLYHERILREKGSVLAAKLAAMLNLRTDRLLKLSAWPAETLHERSGGRLVGFLMPRVAGHKDVHVLYGVKSRLAEFPEARWPFLITAAANAARAFRVVHEHGHVIGDVNHGSVLVSGRATVTLVDCDSFQISAGGQLYHCEVGLGTHTPPELQGKSFRGVTRTPDHDAFGLAVIIFQLLFMGRHPFSGEYRGPGEMPVEKAIGEYRFAYGPGAGSRQMRQPPATLPLEAVSRPVAEMFERAFSRGGPRPDAAQWSEALAGLAANLRACDRNGGHNYLKTLAACPWCDVEVRSGIRYFADVVIVGTWRPGAFDVAGVWAQIRAVPPPGPLPELPAKSSFTTAASPRAARAIKAQRLRALFAAGALLIVSAALLVLPLGVTATAWLVVIAAVVAFSAAGRRDAVLASELGAAKTEAERGWQDAVQRWRGQGDEQRFHQKARELESKKAEYEGLPDLRLRKLQELERNVRGRQLQKFLDRHRIDGASISGIGPARKAMLRSFGIETAADVTSHAVFAVPGFGPTYTSNLVAWRQAIELRFVFDPARGVDPADREAVEKDYNAARSRLELELQNGPTHLRQVSQQIHAARESLRPVAEEALRSLAQAEADLGGGAAKWVTFGPVAAVLGAALLAVYPVKSKLGYAVPGWSGYAPRAAATPSGAASPTPRPGGARNANTSSTPSPEQQAQAAKGLYDQGVVFSRAGKYADAVTSYQQAVALSPDFAEAHHELGYALYKLSRHGESAEASKRALALRPKNAETYRNLGLALAAAGRHAAARDAFREAARIEPGHAATHYNLGMALENSGDENSAAEAYRRAVSLKPDLAGARYRLGLLYVRAGDQEAALEEYTALTSVNPKLAEQLYRQIYK